MPLPGVTCHRESGETEILKSHEVAPHEADLLERFAGPQPIEAFALSRTGAWTGDMSLIQIIIWPDEARLRWTIPKQKDCYYERMLTAEELRTLRRFIEDNHVDDMRSREFAAFDGEDYLYFHITRSAATRVHINNPMVDEVDGPHAGVVKFLTRLADPDHLRVHYRPGILPEGAEPIYASPVNEAIEVWARRDDIRIRIVGRDVTGPREWHRWKDGKLGEIVAAPYPEGERGELPKEASLLNARVHAKWGDKTISLGTNDNETYATWLCQVGQKPMQLFGSMVFPLAVTPAGFLVGTLDHRLISYDLNARRMVPLDPEVANDFECGALVPETGRVLILRKDVPSEFTYLNGRLLDPATGKTGKDVYEFATRILHHRREPCQPTTRPSVIWGATVSQNATHVGQVDVTTGKEHWAEYLGIRLGAVWVDEPAGCFYGIHNGHVIRLPLPAGPMMGGTWSDPAKP